MSFGTPAADVTQTWPRFLSQREFFIDNLLVRNHFSIVMIWWTGLAPWEFDFRFPGSLTSTFLGRHTRQVCHTFDCRSPPKEPRPESSVFISWEADNS